MINHSQKQAIQPDVQANIEAIKRAMSHTQDLIVKRVHLEDDDSLVIIYVSGLSDPAPLLKKITAAKGRKKREKTLVDNVTMIESLAGSRPVNHVTTIDEAVDELIVGNTVFLFDQFTQALTVSTVAVNTRSIEEPDNEVTIKGPHDGFNESIKNNISLVRFHCPSSRLKVEFRELGTVTKSKIAVLSMQGIANEQILQEVHERLSRIPYEAILDINYLEEWITDDRITLFPLVESTERPDRVVAALLEGRVAIMLNGVPMTLIVPYIFFQTFQVSEDYYWRYHISSVLRLMRLFCALITLYLPAFFVATITFHHEFLPTPFLMSIAQGREPVPYPTLVEVLMMEGVFEILREAGIRLPRQVGSAVSIVGALVLGQAAVQAGIVSPVTVILVAFTGISSFTLPSNSGAYAIRLLRFFIILLAGFLGYIGIIMAAIMLLIHLASLRSFGAPYLGPLAPFNLQNSTDVLVRRPLFVNKKRPTLFRVKDRIRFRND